MATDARPQNFRPEPGNDPVNTVAPSTGRVSEPVSWCAPADTTARHLDLSGDDWQFRLFASARSAQAAAPLPFTDGHESSRKAPSWSQIRVPSHWALTGGPSWLRGRPAYTNVQFPFPTNPPFAPDENPTADYRRTFEVSGDKLRGSSRVLLRVAGIESIGIISLNSREVGVFRGSRLQQDFDVTELLRRGKNTLDIRVHQFSAMSYAEDQDQWWLPGIFREIELVFCPRGGIDDVRVTPSFNHLTGSGEALVEVCADASAFPLTVTLPELKLRKRIAGTDADGVGRAVLRADSVEPWSAEVPRLYEIKVSSKGETRRVRTGFRTVTITSSALGEPQLTVNGRKVVFLGVNKHETHPDLGRVFDEAQTKSDLQLMKQHNINAIRTSHYPPHPRLLEMCDELGFWVIDECDLETHGFELHDWRGNPSDDPTWRETLVDRAERMVRRDYNHPSIVMWSLGNESGTGANLAAMAQLIRRLDPERPIHYEGDYDGRYTDVYSRMYARLHEMESILSPEGPFTFAEPINRAHLRSKPFMQCEYLHTMGNGPGALREHVAQFFNHPRHHGGFLWEWRDHGIRSWTRDGREFFAYGGDFGEEVHDGNFVMDGLLLPDGTPSPAMAEVKQAYAPVKLTITQGEDGPLLHAVSRLHSRRSDFLNCSVSLVSDAPHGHGSTVAQPAIATEVRVPLDLAPGEETTVKLADLTDSPIGPDTIVTAVLTLAGDEPWAKAGSHVASAQYVPAPQRALWRDAAGVGGPQASRKPRTRRSRGRNQQALEFNAEGRLVKLFGQEVRDARATFWRAPTDNDEGAPRFGYRSVDPAENESGAMEESSAAFWRGMGLDRMHARIEELREERGSLYRRLRFAAADAERAITVSETWSWDEECADFRLEIQPDANWNGTWPRAGYLLALPADYRRAHWFGYGPDEAYPDSRDAAALGVWDAEEDELFFPYSRPQETGHRPGLRTLLVRGARVPGLRVDTFPDRSLDARFDYRPGFSLLPWSEHELTRAQHPYELPTPRSSYLVFDAAQHGLGSRSCGQDVLPQYALTPRALTVLLRLRRER
ncbi:glycoside hydrolase family 2 TIM barrel-domain containing protein [Dermabacteraceae bacterium P7054]